MGCATSSPAGNADTKPVVLAQDESNLQIGPVADASSSSQREASRRLPGTSAASSAGAVGAAHEVLNLSDIDPVFNNKLPASMSKKNADEELSESASGSDFDSWRHDGDDSLSSRGSRQRPPKPASAKEHHEHVSRLEDFLADMSMAPDGLRIAVRDRRSEARLRRELQDLPDLPQAEVRAAPQPGVRRAEDSSDFSEDSLSQ
eukprot:TRINITY_DN24078_c0_g3_i1.p1 TRINITY_DN24078_c0_g3~~TRINITY_DN24078_c0_g3_i1.p1  ORF type:complete len:203 (-),score=40.25 TRINITY_DN24078_c0_g3_i1:7-615(-)